MPDPSVRAILLASCKDQRGIVASVSDFVNRNGGNILDFDQHTDLDDGTFLQRLSWDLAGFAVPREGIAEAFRPIAQRFGMEFEVRFSDHVPRLAILVSKLDHCLFDLLWRRRIGELRADVSFVISNHPDLQSVAESFGVPYFVHPITIETRASEEQAMLRRLREADVELIVLARYMQVLGPAFVESYPSRMINIHHSFLPAFPGARPYQRAYERGVKVIGATAHYVTQDLDEGPIIEQDVARVSHRDSIADLILKGRDLEKVVLARAVNLHLAHGVLVYGKKTVVFD
jgi:formyltetrahydrofolate deformylase